jgi:tetratricopeptide (TPR) repeat protein
MVDADRTLGTALSRIGARQAEGILHLRFGRWVEAEACLLEGLRVTREVGAGWASASLLQNLATLAFRDGRVREGAAWCREALEAPLSPLAEARFRTTLLTNLLASGEVAEAREQLGLIEMLVQEERPIVTSRAALDLLEGRVERALVQLSTALAGDAPEIDRRAWLFLAFWAHLLLGRPADGAPYLDRIEAEVPPAHTRDVEMLAMARAVLAALGGDSDAARAALGEVRPDSSRKWPAVVRVVEALVDGAQGRPVDRDALEREITAGGIGDLSLRFALDLLGRVSGAPRPGR